MHVKSDLLTGLLSTRLSNVEAIVGLWNSWRSWAHLCRAEPSVSGRLSLVCTKTWWDWFRALMYFLLTMRSCNGYTTHPVFLQSVGCVYPQTFTQGVHKMQLSTSVEGSLYQDVKQGQQQTNYEEALIRACRHYCFFCRDCNINNRVTPSANMKTMSGRIN